MIVKYKNDCDKALMNQLLSDHPILREDQGFDPVLNETYRVYGMILIGDIMWYYLAKQATEILLAKLPCLLFEIMDGRLSKYWIYSFTCGVDAASSRSMIAFPKWAKDPDYERRLRAGNLEDAEVFKTYRNLMDLEYPDETVYKKARVIDDECLFCNECRGTWRSKGAEGMVCCPMCLTVMHNPRYVPRIQV